MTIARVPTQLTTDGNVMNAKGISELSSIPSYITTCINLVSLGLGQPLVDYSLLSFGW